MARSRALSAFLCFLFLVLVCGCGDSGPRRYAVSGKVTYKGESLKYGIISFIPEGAMSATGGAPIADGVYTIPQASGLLEGDYRVSISVPDAKPPLATEAPGESHEPKETLPAKYNANTELRAAVTAGAKNEFDFHLK